ncbi:MAG: hypothetical protein KI792_10760 [Alphaproteobacteria bacterium]|nr:hypothetical protein [Alphaproteobacteria bacterium SS10]
MLVSPQALAGCFEGSIGAMVELDQQQKLRRAIDEGRLYARHQRMAQIGALANDTVDRAAFSVEDLASRSLLVNWAEDRDFEVYLDEIANLSIRLPGQDREAPPVVIGGHIDTVTEGHPFDGLTGVLIGLEVLEAIQDSGLELQRSIETIAWSNVQGDRFPPALMGAQVKVGMLSLEACRALVDERGIRLDDTLERMFETFSSALPRSRLNPIAQYLEPMFDAGPSLADSDMTLGIVDGVDAHGVLKLRLAGRSSPVGATDREHRRDPLIGGMQLVAALEGLVNEWSTDDQPQIRSAVAKLNIDPFLPGSVPARIAIDWSVYMGNEDRLKALLEAAQELVMNLSVEGDWRVTVGCDIKQLRGYQPLDEKLSDQLRREAKHASLRWTDVTCGRSSTVGVLAAAEIPAAAIMLPNRSYLGIDRNRSLAKPDLGHAARLIGAVAFDLANQGDG